jgi:hypothetical protein
VSDVAKKLTPEEREGVHHFLMGMRDGRMDAEFQSIVERGLRAVLDEIWDCGSEGDTWHIDRGLPKSDLPRLVELFQKAAVER